MSKYDFQKNWVLYLLCTLCMY